jgi:hypothetical protein
MGIFIRLPIYAQFQGYEFVQNKGQWPADVQLMAKDGAAKIWLGSDRFLFQLTDFSALEKAHHEQVLLDNPSLPSALVEQRFIGANPKAQAQGLEPRKHTYNFFMGQDSTRWASSAQAFEEVQYRQFYPDIDLTWATEQTQYKYTFHVAPGADAQQIRWTYSGANDVKLNKDRIQLKTAIGEIQDQQLFAYQIVNGQRVQVACTYRSYPGGTYGFQLGNYNAQLPLIIDPVLVFATYNGANSDNFGMTATYGYDASAYAAGMVYGNNFPLPSMASFDSNSNFTLLAGAYGVTDVFVTRYAADGSSMLWSSFLGGGDNRNRTQSHLRFAQ